MGGCVMWLVGPHFFSPLLLSSCCGRENGSLFSTDGPGKRIFVREILVLRGNFQEISLARSVLSIYL